MQKVVISGIGLYTPEHVISNDELVASFNAYVSAFNQQHAAEIEAGEITPLAESSTAFIEKASGIKSRFVIDKQGILDPARMRPRISKRSNNELSVQAEMAVAAAKDALAAAGKTSADVDAIIVACSNLARPYPALAIEIQHALGIKGFAYDLNVACSSATFGIQTAVDAIKAESAGSVLVLNPEICSAHLDFRDRDSHFIFGDACSALLLERASSATAANQYAVLGTQLQTMFSNNIRNNFGFLNRCEVGAEEQQDKLFMQNGRKVFKEVCPAVAQQIKQHLQAQGLQASEVKRFWLHQANLSMNQLISKNLLGRMATDEESPVILDTYANTSSAGSVIAMYKYHQDLQAGDVGVLCSFGAGYSIGSVLLKKV